MEVWLDLLLHARLQFSKQMFQALSSFPDGFLTTPCEACRLDPDPR